MCPWSAGEFAKIRREKKESMQVANEKGIDSNKAYKVVKVRDVFLELEGIKGQIWFGHFRNSRSNMG